MFYKCFNSSYHTTLNKIQKILMFFFFFFLIEKHQTNNEELDFKLTRERKLHLSFSKFQDMFVARNANSTRLDNAGTDEKPECDKRVQEEV